MSATMASESSSTNLEERLKSLLSHLQSESGILDRLVYKNKNQHRRCPYFQALLKVRRDLKLLHSAGLGDVLNALFPIIEGKKPAQKAFLLQKRKKNKSIGQHNYEERLLGVARLLSQMAEPILKAAIQISFLLAKSFFTKFCVAIIALLARLRLLVQQILLDVVSVFNKISSLSQQKQSVKLIEGGIEVFREYYPSSGDVLTLECAWKTDKYVLLERTHNSNIKKQNEDQGALSVEQSIQYEPLQLFSEEEMLMQPAITSSEDQPATTINFINAEDCPKVSIGEPHFEAELFVGGESVSSPKSLGPQTELSDKVAFFDVKKSNCFETDMNVPNKKMKLDEAEDLL